MCINAGSSGANNLIALVVIPVGLIVAVLIMIAFVAKFKKGNCKP